MSITNNPQLMRLLTKIYEDKGLDFTQYKEKSLLRRIGSRLSAHNAESYDKYINILEGDPKEYDKLLDSLTINVTEFFRNPELFSALEKDVIPRIIYAKRTKQHKIVRVWSCGCSSGDEAYSLAMLFLKKLGGQIRDGFLLTIIGSDIDKSALMEAKNVLYLKDRLKVINKTSLDAYFDKTDDKYRLKDSVSSLVSFRHHDVINNKPFMHCDLILCRNLLIYFNKELQEETLFKFYDALNPGGFLVLGMVESLFGAVVNAFENVNNRLRIYRRPEELSRQYNKTGVLPQDRVDKIVKEMLER